MKTYTEMKPGDIVYDCDFDTHEDEVLPIEDVEELIETYVVVHHSHPHHKGNLYLARVDVNSFYLKSERGNAECPIAYLTVPADEVATTMEEAVRLEAARRAKYGQSYVRDAAVLRQWLETH